MRLNDKNYAVSLNYRYIVYAISSINRNYIYVGITDDLVRRFKQHQLGYNKTTRPYRPFRLIFSEETADRKQARIREKFYKSTPGKSILKQLALG